MLGGPCEGSRCRWASECLAVDRGVEEPPTHRGMTGELQVCEPVCMITECVRIGTSELVMERVSVDMGMCIKKARVRGTRYTGVGVHMCKDVERVCHRGR